MPHGTTLIPGDGTAPETAESTVRVIEATGVQFNWDVKQAGIAAAGEYGSIAQLAELYEHGPHLSGL